MSDSPPDVPLLRPDVFAGFPELVAGFTTRDGGVSEPPYGSLNLGRGTEDRPERILENRRRLLAALGFPPDRLATAFQVHGTDVRVIDAPGGYQNCDGLVTATPGILLGIVAADCAAVLLADPERRVIGACHAGWRGASGGIAGKTVACMQTLGARPDRIRAYVGPCISAGSFEVGEEVAAQFADEFVHRVPGRERPHVDLKAAIGAQLVEAGVPAEAVEIDPHCTASDLGRFFSHRAERGRTGRMMGVIGMREPGGGRRATDS